MEKILMKMKAVLIGLLFVIVITGCSLLSFENNSVAVGTPTYERVPVAPTVETYCGDGLAQFPETCGNCPQDAGLCTPAPDTSYPESTQTPEAVPASEPDSF